MTAVTFARIVSLAVLVTSASAGISLAAGGRPPTFGQPKDYDPEITGSQWVELGDVLHRGIIDLVVTHANEFPGHVSLLFGKGDGTFGAPKTVFTGTLNDEVVQARLADMTGDGKLDLVMLTTTSGGGEFFTIALGDGKGDFTFASQTLVNAGRFVIGKFGNATLPGIFVQAPYALPAEIYMSDGKGGLKPSIQLSYGGGAGGLVPVDVNHDGILDLVGIGEGPQQDPERLQTLFGMSGAPYFAPPRYTLPGLEELYNGVNTGVTAAAGDLRSDGNTDLVVFGSDSQERVPVVGSVYLGRPDGTFETPLLLPVRATLAYGGAAAIADFNGDGFPDIFLTAFLNSSSPQDSYVMQGEGDGTFPTDLQRAVPVFPLNPNIVVADLNHDKRPDVIMSDSTTKRGVWVLLNSSSKKKSIGAE